MAHGRGHGHACGRSRAATTGCRSRTRPVSAGTDADAYLASVPQPSAWHGSGIPVALFPVNARDSTCAGRPDGCRYLRYRLRQRHGTRAGSRGRHVPETGDAPSSRSGACLRGSCIVSGPCCSLRAPARQPSERPSLASPFRGRRAGPLLRKRESAPQHFSSPSTPRRPRRSRTRSGGGLPFGLWRRLSEGDGQGPVGWEED